MLKGQSYNKDDCSNNIGIKLRKFSNSHLLFKEGKLNLYCVPDTILSAVTPEMNITKSLLS